VPTFELFGAYVADIGDYRYRWGMVRKGGPAYNPEEIPVIVAARSDVSSSSENEPVPLSLFTQDPLRGRMMSGGTPMFRPRPPRNEEEHEYLLKQVGLIRPD